MSDQIFFKEMSITHVNIDIVLKQNIEINYKETNFLIKKGLPVIEPVRIERRRAYAYT